MSTLGPKQPRESGGGESVWPAGQSQSSGAGTAPLFYGRTGPRSVRAFVLMLVLLALVVSDGWAQTRAEEQGTIDRETLGIAPSSAAPKDSGSSANRGEEPGLEALLQLPSGYLEPTNRTVGGAGESAWRSRFAKVQEELRDARKALEVTKVELDEVADSGGSSQWAVAPPGVGNSGGGGPSTSPLSFKLRQALVRDRERLDAAEKALRELRIEADLAGVPKAWRGDDNAPIPRRLPATDHLK